VFRKIGKQTLCLVEMNAKLNQFRIVTGVALSAILVTALFFFFPQTSANEANRTVLQLSIDGTIGPATDDYIARALDSAARSDTELVVIRMDTPGGLDSAMRGIIKNIAGSSVPVASFVAPTGARAASAGTYILYASHISAMAPGTNLGSATPVQIGGISPPRPKGQKEDKEKDKGNDQDQDKSKKKAKDKEAEKPEDTEKTAMQRKIINDAVAYIRGFAEMHGRNADWAEKAVREAASLTATEALKLNVIDIVAEDVADLLKQADGREVSFHGRKHRLDTAGLTVRQVEPDWRSRLLSVITNPNVAYILMLIGIYGLIFEFSNPGAIVPGTVGAIALLLALYAFQMLPINYAGMGLILLGVALMVGEAFQPSFGMLGIGGVTAFVIGSVILIDTDAPGFGIDVSVIITFAITSALVFIMFVGMAIKARRRPVVSGLEELLGAEATVIDDFDRKGSVSIHSETWRAISDIPLKKDQQVKVTGVKGLVLEVKPVENTGPEEN
jgi:membrane-bound serine protease (ClpP class)